MKKNSKWNDIIAINMDPDFCLAMESWLLNMGPAKFLSTKSRDTAVAQSRLDHSQKGCGIKQNNVAKM